MKTVAADVRRRSWELGLNALRLVTSAATL